MKALISGGGDSELRSKTHWMDGEKEGWSIFYFIGLQMQAFLSDTDVDTHKDFLQIG